MTRRRLLPWLLFLAFVVMPLVELYVLIQVGQVIGVWWTILLLLADAVLGSWLVKREGRRAFAALREALGSGRMPARELADGILIVIGGTLMVSPGFVTDIVGLLLILPLTRPVARRLLTAAVSRRLLGTAGPLAPFGGARPRSGAAGPHEHPHGRAPGQPDGQQRPGDGPGPVVRGEVVDD